MAELEAEAFQLGNWRNFDDLEESLNLPELMLIIKKMREKDHRDKKFLAAMQGIDLDKGQNSEVQKRIKEVEARAAARLTGDENALEKAEYADMGFEFQTA